MLICLARVGVENLLRLVLWLEVVGGRLRVGMGFGGVMLMIIWTGVGSSIWRHCETFQQVLGVV